MGDWIILPWGQCEIFIFIDDFVKELRNFENSGVSFSEFYMKNNERVLDKRSLFA